MTVEIVKATPQAPSKFLVIGEPFAGKTTLAAKSPSPLFISTDGNAAKAGLHAVNVKSVTDIREAMELGVKSKDYKTLVIDTSEGIVDIFTKGVLDEFNKQGFKTTDGKNIASLNDVPYGRATGVLNSRVSAFANALANINMNVIVLSYTKRRIDDISGSIMLDSEFKNIRLLTRFMDAQVLTLFDGEKHKANIISKREIMAGKVDFGDIESFLTAIGWELPKKSVKVGKVK
jgi:hypothetical protein